MIYLMFVVVSIILVAIIAYQQIKYEEVEVLLWDEVRDHAETRKQLTELQRQKKVDIQTVPDKAIRQRYQHKPSAEDYYSIFEAHPIGRIVSDDLVNKFGGVTYVRGGQDAERESCFRAGKKYVVDHILMQINNAHKAPQIQYEVTTDDN
ncbi:MULTISPECIES: Bbp19 family protein [Acinetobacter]|uniref:Bbp19 family protein n=1 Tax=Acinetobacter TaxID=469 RepID=UPI0002CFC882|nr:MULTISPECIES: hypothetical protein [Acinetobacter]ENV02415.1 hypothetical protein F968_02471 [Acinetobacter sp. NIPH 817]